MAEKHSIKEQLTAVDSSGLEQERLQGEEAGRPSGGTTARREPRPWSRRPGHRGLSRYCVSLLQCPWDRPPRVPSKADVHQRPVDCRISAYACPSPSSAWVGRVSAIRSSIRH